MPDFATLFDQPPSIRAQAPGRVNLIGEHTDYNGGAVLPVAIPHRTVVELALRSTPLVRVWSANLDSDSGPREFSIGSEKNGRGWLDYVQGVTWALSSGGHRLTGFDARIESTVPIGSGLSSSAALEVSVLRALRLAFHLPLDDVALAMVARRGENDFVGAPVGIMDPMAASLADERTALFLDTRTLRYERIPIPSDTELAIVDSGIAHAHCAGEYRVRQAECARARELLGVAELCDVPSSELPRLAALPAPLDRRARHVITEHLRVLAAVRALGEGDSVSVGHLFYGSHASMRDDYEVSVPDVDLLVDLARAEPAVFGARLTGGGFGGSVVMLVVRGKAAGVAARVSARYSQQTGRPAAIHLPRPASS